MIPAAILEWCAKYETEWQLPPLSVVDAIDALLELDLIAIPQNPGAL